MLQVKVDYVRDTARLYDSELERVPSENIAEMVEHKEWTLIDIEVLYDGEAELILMRDGMELDVYYGEIELVPVADRLFLYAVQERLYSEDWIETCECCGPQPVFEEYGNNTLFMSRNLYAALEYAKSLDENEIYFDDILISIVYLDEEIDNGGNLNG